MVKLPSRDVRAEIKQVCHSMQFGFWDENRDLTCKFYKLKAAAVPNMAAQIQYNTKLSQLTVFQRSVQSFMLHSLLSVHYLHPDLCTLSHQFLDGLL